MKKLLIIALLSVGFVFQGMAQDEVVDVNARVKALYIYNFSKNVDWPKSYKKGNFVIGVIGNEAVYKKLIELYSTKTIGAQPIEIKQFSKSSDIKGCHLIYVANSRSSSLPSIVKAQSGTSALVIGENDDALGQGAVINFLFSDQKLKFTISKKNADKRDLFIGQNLEKWALSVER